MLFLYELCASVEPRFCCINEHVVSNGFPLEGMFFVVTGRFSNSQPAAEPSDLQPNAIRTSLSTSSTSGEQSWDLRGSGDTDAIERRTTVTVGRVASDASPLRRDRVAKHFFAIECIFSSKAEPIASYDMVAGSTCEIALVTRRRFDQLLDHNDQMRSYVQFLRMKVAEGRVGVDELPHGLPTELRKEYLTCHLGRTNTRMKSEDLGVSGYT